MMNKFIFVYFIVFFCLFADKIDLKKVKNIGFILPSPAQLFNSLAKGEKLGWKDQVLLNDKWNYKSRAKLALNLGARSCDAMALIYDDDYDSAGKLWKVILNLVDNLNLSSITKERSEKIKAALGSKDKKMIRELIDEIHAASEKRLKENKDNDLAVVVSVGGWVEGFYLVSKGLSKKYDEETSKILHQSDLAKFYLEQLQKMPKTYKKDSAISAIMDEIPNIQKLIETANDKSIPLENVKKVLEITAKLKSKIEEE